MLLQLQKVLIGAFIPHLDKELKLLSGCIFSYLFDLVSSICRSLVLEESSLGTLLIPLLPFV
jgi:hypothetical protein